MSAYRARVLTISTRASKGLWEDTSGPVIASALEAIGVQVLGIDVIPDGPLIRENLKRYADQEKLDLVISTGGTGISPTDETYLQTLSVIDRQIPGISELIRYSGFTKGILNASLSSGVAGVRGSTLIINLPGSKSGVSDGMEVLSKILPHALDQKSGVDHQRKD